MTTKIERSLIFKNFQSMIKKENTFDQGIEELLKLRKELLNIINFIYDYADKKNFISMPLKSDKTIAYYLYHLMRIEDITCNTLIKNEQQIFFKENYQKKLNSPIITTGNELKREQLIDFSKALNIYELKKYIYQVIENTNKVISEIDYKNSKNKVSEKRKENLLRLNSVSTDENAFWLVEYWCKKTYAGLFLMPFSRHLMLHLDGCLRILKKDKLI